MAHRRRTVLLCDDCGVESRPGETLDDARWLAADDGWAVGRILPIPIAGPMVDWCDLCWMQREPH